MSAGTTVRAGASQKKRFANVVRGEILLQEQLQTIGDRLDQSEEVEVLFPAEKGERDADAVRADAVLDDRGEAALEVDRERDQRQDHQEGEEHDLEHDDREVDCYFRHGGKKWAVIGDS